MVVYVNQQQLKQNKMQFQVELICPFLRSDGQESRKFDFHIPDEETPTATLKRLTY